MSLLAQPYHLRAARLRLPPAATVGSSATLGGVAPEQPALKPEKSAQLSLGTMFEPSRQRRFSLSYWNIQVKVVISTLGEQVIIENPVRYNDSYIARDEDCFIANIILRKENQG